MTNEKNGLTLVCKSLKIAYKIIIKYRISSSISNIMFIMCEMLFYCKEDDFMKIYTVSFFGHRYIENICEIERKIEEIIRELICGNEYADFLVGRDGEFDQLVSSTVKRMKNEMGYSNNSLIWVMPYDKAEYENNRENFEKYYDEIEVCYESSIAHPKSAIQIRNRRMIDRSDLVIFYVRHNSGGAYKTMEYAIKIGKRIINLGEDI